MLPAIDSIDEMSSCKLQMCAVEFAFVRTSTNCVKEWERSSPAFEKVPSSRLRIIKLYIMEKAGVLRRFSFARRHTLP